MADGLGVQVASDILRDPTASDRFASWFRRENIVASAGLWFGVDSGIEEDPSYDFREDAAIQPYLEREGVYSATFAESKSAEHSLRILNRLLQEQRDLEAVHQSGFLEAFTFGGLAAFLSPESLIPGAALVKAGRVGSIAGNAIRVGASAAATTSVVEAGLLASQDLRQWDEAVANVAGSAVLGTLLGAGGTKILQARHAAAEEYGEQMGKLWEAERDGLDVQGEVMARSLSAAVADEISTLRSQGRNDLVLDVMVRLTNEVFAENGITLNKGKRGLPARIPIINRLPINRLAFNRRFETYPVAVEALVESAYKKVAPGIGGNVESAISGRTGQGRSVNGKIKKLQRKVQKNRKDGRKFREQVTQYARNPSRLDLIAGGAVGNRRDAIRAGGEELRSLADEAERLSIEAGFFTGELGGILGDTAELHIHRLYNRPLLVRDAPLRDRFVEDVESWITQRISDGISDNNPDATPFTRAEELVELIVQNDDISVNKPTLGTKFRDRAIDIPDHVLEPYLLNDSEKVVHNLTTHVFPMLEMAAKFRRRGSELDGLYESLKQNVFGRPASETVGHHATTARLVNDLDIAEQGWRIQAERSTSQKAVDKRNKRAREKKQDSREVTAEEYGKAVRRYEADVVQAFELRLRILDEPGDAELLSAMRVREEELTLGIRAFQSRVLTKKKTTESGGMHDEAFAEKLAKDYELASEEELLEPIDFGEVVAASTVSRAKASEARIVERLRATRAQVASEAMNMTLVESRANAEFRDYILLNPEDASKARADKRKSTQYLEHIKEEILRKNSRNEPDTLFAFAERTFRQSLFLSKMGGFVLSTLPDVAMGTMVYGFSRQAKVLHAFATDYHGMLKAAGADITREIAMLEIAGHGYRHNALYHMDDIHDRSLSVESPKDVVGNFEKGLAHTANAFQWAAGMKPWQFIMKGKAGIMASDAILGIARDVTAGKALSKADSNIVNRTGLNLPQLQAINEYFGKYGQTTGGVRLGRSKHWNDSPRGREIQKLYESVVINETNNTILTPGLGDKPRFMSLSGWRTIGMFRSFAFTATNRLLISGFQRQDANLMSGLMFMLTVGHVTNVLKNAVAGREPKPLDSPEAVFEAGINAVDRAGLLGILSDVGMIGSAVGQAAYGDRITEATFDRFQDRNLVDVLFGVGPGALSDYGRTVGDLQHRGGPGEGLDDDALRRLKRQVPFNNLFYLRALFDGFDLGSVEYEGLLN